MFECHVHWPQTQASPFSMKLFECKEEYLLAVYNLIFVGREEKNFKLLMIRISFYLHIMCLHIGGVFPYFR